MSIEIDYERLRREMVRRQIASRGIRDEALLEAMARVRREGYIPSWLGEFAYEDSPLPIEEEQTISQPYIVATMIDALRIGRSSRVLEVGTGSGYAAAVLAELASEVYTVERHASLAQAAHDRLRRDGYHNVHVQHADGSLGWPEHSPYDAIVVAAGAPRVPENLKRQLKVGGRLVMPVGKEPGLQQLVRVVRTHDDRWTTEELGAVRFVPLVGAQGWREEAQAAAKPSPLDEDARTAIMRRCEPFVDSAGADLAPVARRIGSARVVLIGESTHGTSEFYRLRARLTRELVEKHGFAIVALEADWPDVARIDGHARDLRVPEEAWEAFARFPTWMWRNEETREFVEWLRARNMGLPAERRARLAGLDLYSMSNSIAALLGFLDRRDPEAAALARERYSCLTPWQREPAAY